MADFTIKQGDVSPVLNDTLTYSDGTIPNITGHSINFVMRSLTANDVTTNQPATIVSGPAGTVSYTFTTSDTKTAGLYQAYWNDTTFGMVFPTVGYITVEIQQNITTPGGASLVALGDVKDYLNITGSDRSHDGELLRFIDACTPVIEAFTGPILVRDYQNETYDGGMSFISLKHRPVIEVNQVVEYRGPIPYQLTQVFSPDLGTIYSYMFEPPGRIVRRTVGGGMTTFPPGYDSVFITYRAGRAVVPANVREACLELIRVNYQQTQQAGRSHFGGLGGGQSMDEGSSIALDFIPRRVFQLLEPTKRHPSIA